MEAMAGGIKVLTITVKLLKRPTVPSSEHGQLVKRLEHWKLAFLNVHPRIVLISFLSVSQPTYSHITLA